MANFSPGEKTPPCASVGDRTLHRLARNRRARGLLALALWLHIANALLACRSLPWTAPDDRVPEPLPVQKAEEELVLAVWAEPPQLPEGGGQTQVLVRVRKRGGKPFPGVEVRLATSTGSLYSGGRVLVTDARGMTRDRLTSGKSAVVTLNAGGTRYRFRVPVGEKAK